MLKVVLDTNVLISALIHAGKPKQLIDSALAGETALVLSEEIIDELRKVLARDKFKLPKDKQSILTNFVVRLATVIEVKSKFRVIREDPEDNAVLNTAYDGKADYIVSGDRHLLALREFRGIKIVTAGEMLTLLGK